MNSKTLAALTLECLGHIAQAQIPSGAFLSTSRSLCADTPERVYVSPFFTGLILHALSTVPVRYGLVSRIQERACNFLLSQQSEQYSFNYWQRESDMAREFPYPDDLDDTFSIQSAISRVRPELCNAAALAHFTRLLVATEACPGGPYRTWLSQKSLTPPEELLPDIAVNANVGYFLKLQGLHVEPLLSYLHSQIESSAFASRYYPSVWPVLYFLARSISRTSYTAFAYCIAKESRILDASPDLLFSALRLLVLISIDAPPEFIRSARTSVVSLAEQGWASSPFCFDPVISGSQYAAYSEALTRALVLESLWSAQEVSNPYPSVSSIGIGNALSTSGFHTAVHAAVVKHVQSLPKEISERALEAHAVLMRKDAGHQIASLPTWFAREEVKMQSSLGEAAIRLGMASVFGWIAYTIYDSIMDTAKGAVLLPVANTLLLELSYIYGDLLKSAPEVLKLFKTVMARMEAGNLWELSHTRIQVENGVCTLPEQGVSFLPMQPAEKSIGHALAPLTFSFIQSRKAGTFDAAGILRFFEHYLTARQLNDDAHDWFEDTLCGHLTMANSMVLQGCSRNGYVDLIGQKLAMQRYFWNIVLPHIAGTINYHITQARAALHALHLPESPRIEANLLDPLEQSARTALADSANAALFLKEYV